jgi:hypothetical protein
MLKGETTDFPSRAKENRRGGENFFGDALANSAQAGNQDKVTDETAALLDRALRRDDRLKGGDVEGASLGCASPRRLFLGVKEC